MRSAAGRELKFVEARRSYLPLLAAAGTCAAAAVGFASAPMRLANARVDGAVLISIAACQTVAAIAVLGSTLPRRAWPAIALVVTNLFAILAWGSADSWGSPRVASAFDRPDVLARGCAAVGFLAAISSATPRQQPRQRGEAGRDAVATPSITEIGADAPLGMNMAGMAHDMTKPMCAPAWMRSYSTSTCVAYGPPGIATVHLGRDPYVALTTDAFEKPAAAVAGTAAEPSAALAALTQYRSALCADMTRGALTSLTGDGKLIEVVCDPVRNPPLPGLRPPGWATVAAALRSVGVPIG